MDRKVTIIKVWDKDRVNQLSGQVLAYIGDAVQSLMVRCALADAHDARSHDLHLLSIQQVNAEAQARRMDHIATILTEEELAIYRRGRNAKVLSKPKHVDLAEYKKATGFEALLGFLYLTGNTERLTQLLG